MEGGSESYRIPHHHGGGKAIESSLSGKIVFLSQIHGQSGTRVATDGQSGTRVDTDGQSGTRVATVGQSGTRVATDGQSGTRVAIHGQSGTRVATDDFGGIYQKFTSYKTQTNF